MRERAGLFDVSHMGQIQLGQARGRLPQSGLVTCEVASLWRRPRPLRADAERVDGGCVDDVMVTRVAEDAYFFCVNAAERRQVRGTGSRRTAESRRPGRGPQPRHFAARAPGTRGSAAILERLDPRRGPRSRNDFRVADAARSPACACLASGTGYTGSPGFELYAANGDAPALWRGDCSTRAKRDGRPARRPRCTGHAPSRGGAAPLRTRARRGDHGSPFEAGLDRFVKPLDGFIGADALACGAPRNPTRGDSSASR